MKFVFATTEIRKVPITVLSRCQRFDLRRVRVAELYAHFARIAAKEGVAIEPAALEQIARAADGSVRDGLSMLDQAIAQADGDRSPTAQVADMLGLADREAVFDLMEAVMGGKPAAALAITDRAYERGADLGALLQDLLELLHTVTRLKSVPGLRDSQELPEAERTRGAALADRLTRAGAGPRLADAAEGRRRGGNRARPPRRGRNGADPAVPCVRPADAGRSGPAADRRRRPRLHRLRPRRTGGGWRRSRGRQRRAA